MEEESRCDKCIARSFCGKAEFHWKRCEYFVEDTEYLIKTKQNSIVSQVQKEDDKDILNIKGV